MQSKQINNCKQILTGCALFAADQGAGRYPSGRYDPKLPKLEFDEAAESAEECFQDLFDSRIIDLEALFYNNRSYKQCDSVPPNENGVLEAGENCWDIISGMDNGAGNLPLLVEASDNGEGKLWTYEGGHPWYRSLIVGMADGSSTKRESLSRKGALYARRGPDGDKVDMLVPIPGKHSWPKLAKYTGATQVNPDWQAPPRPVRSETKFFLAVGLSIAALIALGVMMKRDRKRRTLYGYLIFGIVIGWICFIFVWPMFTRVI